eukprot:425019_1
MSRVKASESKSTRGLGVEVRVDDGAFRNFKETVGIPFYDALLANLETRLADSEILGAVASFVPTKFPEDMSELDKHGNNDLEVIIGRLTNQKDEDGNAVPDYINSAQIREEWKTLKVFTMCGTNASLKNADTLTSSTREICKNPAVVLQSTQTIVKMFDWVLGIPLDNGAIERDVKYLKNIKTKNRCRLENKHLNMLMNVARNGKDLMAFNVKEAVKIFLSQKHRKLRTPDSLNK